MEPSDISMIISICNAVIAVFVMQMKTMRSILIGQITINLIGAVSFFLLEGYSAASICTIGIIQCVIMSIYNQKGVKPHLPVIGLFMMAYIACSVVYYTSPVDILGALAALFFAISVTRTKPSVARIWNALNPLTWMLYDICIGGYGQIVMHFVIFASVAIAIVRLDIIPKHKAKKETTND